MNFEYMNAGFGSRSRRIDEFGGSCFERFDVDENGGGSSERIDPPLRTARAPLLSPGVTARARHGAASQTRARSRLVVTATRMGMVALVLAWGIFVSSACGAREVVDMLGRHVTVPDTITRIYSTAPPTTWVVCAMKPESLIGWNFTPGLTEQDARTFLDARTVSLPVLGNMMGHGQQANLEEVLSMKPDLVVAWANMREPCTLSVGMVAGRLGTRPRRLHFCNARRGKSPAPWRRALTAIHLII